MFCVFALLQIWTYHCHNWKCRRWRRMISFSLPPLLRRQNLTLIQIHSLHSSHSPLQICRAAPQVRMNSPKLSTPGIKRGLSGVNLNMTVPQVRCPVTVPLQHLNPYPYPHPYPHPYSHLYPYPYPYPHPAMR